MVFYRCVVDHETVLSNLLMRHFSDAGEPLSDPVVILETARISLNTIQAHYDGAGFDVLYFSDPCIGSTSGFIDPVELRFVSFTKEGVVTIDPVPVGRLSCAVARYTSETSSMVWAESRYGVSWLEPFPRDSFAEIGVYFAQVGCMPQE